MPGHSIFQRLDFTPRLELQFVQFGACLSPRCSCGRKQSSASDKDLRVASLLQLCWPSCSHWGEGFLRLILRADRSQETLLLQEARSAARSLCTDRGLSLHAPLLYTFPLSRKAAGWLVQELAPIAPCQHTAPFCQVNSQQAISTQLPEPCTFKGSEHGVCTPARFPQGSRNHTMLTSALPAVLFRCGALFPAFSPQLLS